MTVTIDVIAQRVGVSRSTVSRALNDHPRISTAIKQRVRAAAAELGYIPNHVAQSLSVRRTLSLGMVITHIANPYIWQVVDGVEQVAAEYGYSVFLSMARGNSAREIGIIEEFQRRRVDGILVASSHLVASYAEQLRHIQTPIVLINSQSPSEHLMSVSIDDRAAGELATQHLVEQGHRHIAYISAPDRPHSDNARYAGCCAALARCGLMPVHIQDDDLHAPQGTQDFERGTRAAAAVLASGVTAAFCYNDSIALGLMAQVQRAGAHVPDDISVIGLDDIDMARDWTPALTTVRQPKYEMGRAAAMYLMQSPLPGHDTVRPLLLPCDLVVRASTAPLTAAPGSHTEASA